METRELSTDPVKVIGEVADDLCVLRQVTQALIVFSKGVEAPIEERRGLSFLAIEIGWQVHKLLQRIDHYNQATGIGPSLSAVE